MKKPHFAKGVESANLRLQLFQHFRHERRGERGERRETERGEKGREKHHTLTVFSRSLM